MRIHREGLRIVLITILSCCAIGLLVWLFSTLLWFLVTLVLLLGLTLFVLHFFRNPRRLCVTSSDLVYSPADGRIVAIERVEESEVIGGAAIQISVFMSVWNVHANFYPIGGTVSYTRYHPGKFLVAWLPKSSTENERSTVAVRRSDGVEVVFRQIAGFVARRIITYSQLHEPVKQGHEFGFIRFGSRVDIFLPLDAEILVSIGEKVRSRETALAKVAIRGAADSQ